MTTGAATRADALAALREMFPPSDPAVEMKIEEFSGSLLCRFRFPVADGAFPAPSIRLDLDGGRLSRYCFSLEVGAVEKQDGLEALLVGHGGGGFLRSGLYFTVAPRSHRLSLCRSETSGHLSKDWLLTRLFNDIKMNPAVLLTMPAIDGVRWLQNG